MMSSPHRGQRGRVGNNRPRQRDTIDDLVEALDTTQTPPKTKSSNNPKRHGRRRGKTSVIVPGSSIAGASNMSNVSNVSNRYGNGIPKLGSHPSVQRNPQHRRKQRFEGGGQGMSRNEYRNSNRTHGRNNHRNRRVGAGAGAVAGKIDFLAQAAINQNEPSRKKSEMEFTYASTNSKRRMNSSMNKGGRYKSEVCTMEEDEIVNESFYQASPPSSQEHHKYKQCNASLDEDEDNNDDFNPSANPDSDTDHIDTGIQIEPDDVEAPIQIDDSDSDSHFSHAERHPQQQLQLEEESSHEDVRNTKNATSSFFRSFDIKSNLCFSKQNNARGKKTKKGNKPKVDTSIPPPEIDLTSTTDEYENTNRNEDRESRGDRGEGQSHSMEDQVRKKSRCENDYSSILEKIKESDKGSPKAGNGDGEEGEKNSNGYDEERDREIMRREEKRRSDNKVMDEYIMHDSSDALGQNSKGSKEKKSRRKRRLYEDQDREPKNDDGGYDLRSFIEDSKSSFLNLEQIKSEKHREVDTPTSSKNSKSPQRGLSPTRYATGGSADFALDSASALASGKSNYTKRRVDADVEPRNKYGSNNVINRNEGHRSKRSKKSYGKNSPPRRRSQRHKPKSNKKKENEIIILSSDESEISDYDNEDMSPAQHVNNEDGSFDSDDEYSSSEAEFEKSKTRISPRRSQRKKIGSLTRIGVSRIAIGNKVCDGSCFVSYQPGAKSQYMRIEYTNKGGEEKEHKIDQDKISEIKYFTPIHDSDKKPESENDNESERENNPSDNKEERTKCCYIIIRTTPTTDNGLVQYSNCYLDDAKFNDLEDDSPKDDGDNGHKPGKNVKDRKKRYVVVEMRNREDFDSIFNLMQNDQQMISTMINCQGAQLKPSNKDEYLSAFTMRKTRFQREKKDTQFLQEQTVLVYPFEATPSELDTAAQGLTEANGCLKKDDDAKMIDVEKDLTGTETAEKTTSLGKTHMVTVRGEDYERLLDPYEFLNDTLIDFWLKWIMRKEDAKESDIYILTTQFFSKLEDEGPESISSWTAKKGIDIFEKKLIFIPVNKDIHWSLFVIVNPGKVMNIIDFYDKQTEAGDESEMDVNDEETDVPFILFLDSLRAHKPSRLRQSLYKWLNFEADRLKKFAKHAPFQKQTMPVCFPNAPTQNNSWDCGVFVCRFAYAIWHMRNNILKAPINEFMNEKKRKKLVQNWVTSPEFEFDMEDIKRLREEIATLINKLSKIYFEAKRKQRIAKRDQKKKEEDEKKLKGNQKEVMI